MPIFEVYQGKSLRGIVNEPGPIQAETEAQKIYGSDVQVYAQGIFRDWPEDPSAGANVAPGTESLH